MKKTFIILCFSATALFLQAQDGNVGINTQTPVTTLDVVGEPADQAKADGIIAPRITKEELINKIPGTYSISHRGAIVYVTDLSANTSSETKDITETGYYSWNGNAWENMKGNSWNLEGNSGTNANINFIGTTDNQDIIFKRESQFIGKLGGNYTGGVISFGNSSYGGNNPNIAIGNNALRSIQEGGGIFEGKYNIGIGDGALQNVTTGAWNVLVGGGGSYLTTGTDNVILGRFAGNMSTGSNNIILGQRPYENNSSGSSNIIMGSNAFRSSASGSLNVILGSHAAERMQTGDYNVIMGFASGSNALSGQENMFLGHLAYAPFSENPNRQLNLDNQIFGYFGKIGIGDIFKPYIQDQNVITRNPPLEQLEVDGNVRVLGTNAIMTEGDPCNTLGTITFNKTDGSFYGCTGTATGTWKKLNN